MDDLKALVAQLAEVAQTCPEHLQETCFRVLLEHKLGQAARMPLQEPPESPPIEEQPPRPEPPEEQELVMADLHVKVRKYLEQHSLTISMLNNLFYKEGGDILPLYDDLKTTRMSESQVRIALLMALRRAFANGEFAAEVEGVREECKARKCYDPANFAAHFRNNESLFNEKYARSVKALTLSADGKAELAKVIGELQ